MNKNINESLNLLLADYKRLKLKEKNKIISEGERVALEKLSFFLGKKN